MSEKNPVDDLVIQDFSVVEHELARQGKVVKMPKLLPIVLCVSMVAVNAEHYNRKVDPEDFE